MIPVLVEETMVKADEKTEAHPVNVDVLATHYQKTFEVTYEYWKERNKLFVILVLTAGIGLLLLLRIPAVNELAVAAISKSVGITDQYFKDQLLLLFQGPGSSEDVMLEAAIAKFLKITDLEKFLNITDQTAQMMFLFNVLFSGVLMVMFYLMQRLYSTNLSVMRNFIYLGALENEIRKHLGLSKESISFTREGSFYWGKRSLMQSMSKYYYVVILLILIIPFISTKFVADIQFMNFINAVDRFTINLTNNYQVSNPIVILVDGIVSILTILYLLDYARSSIQLDVSKIDKLETSKPDIVPEPKQETKVTRKKKQI
jgi:hypothetical protein